MTAKMGEPNKPVQTAMRVQMGFSKLVPGYLPAPTLLSINEQ